MAIISTDIVYRLSGGAANSDPNASLGGAKSSTVAGTNIFDDVSSAEATAGDIEYRCVYVHNGHATLTYLGSKIWIQANTPSTSTDIFVGLGTAGLNATEQTIANEAVDFSTGLSIGDIPAGQHFSVWVRRNVTAGAAGAADSFTLRIQGDTNP